MRRLFSRRARLAGAAAALALLTAPTTADAVAPTGSIAGTVTDATTHQPIAGVLVCAVSETYFEEIEEFCAHSAANGTYSIGELPEERYVVEFIPSADGLDYVYQAWEDQPTPFEAKLVKVTTAEVPGIDAALTEGGMIGGVVTGYPTGAPIAGIEACAEPKGLEAVSVCATSGGTGQYTITGLTGGEYRVEFRAPEELEFLGQAFDLEPGLLQADPVAVQTGQLTPNVDATLLEGGQIAGRVTDAVTHAPISGVLACASPTLGRADFGFPCGQTGADGRYLIKRVHAGDYTVHYYTNEAGPGEYGPRDYTGVCGDDTVAVTVGAGALTAGIDTGLFRSGSIGQGPPSCTVTAERPPTTRLPKPKKCGKGTKSKVVHGKRRCVKVRKHAHRKPQRERTVTASATQATVNPASMAVFSPR